MARRLFHIWRRWTVEALFSRGDKRDVMREGPFHNQRDRPPATTLTKPKPLTRHLQQQSGNHTAERTPVQLLRGLPSGERLTTAYQPLAHHTAGTVAPGGSKRGQGDGGEREEEERMRKRRTAKEM
ncbi:unnamed protein product [Pleuronectes platessa]|uniref:Uncharacterized protein n=1 Tax=Pleuronectes platessa TaxID=8262 RepID=A0A9N7ZA22_PLEPL|nr:unnamed protein product [Pleuronectes platessa]